MREGEEGLEMLKWCKCGGPEGELIHGCSRKRMGTDLFDLEKKVWLWGEGRALNRNRRRETNDFINVQLQFKSRGAHTEDIEGHYE